MKKILIIVGLSLVTYAIFSRQSVLPVTNSEPIWVFKSIDTMKYSRDVSREKLNDRSFDFIIDQQVSNIAKTGASHVAIATPYDDEFLPILTRWVAAARKYNLKVWFRGNWSGWEKWFGYPPIDRAIHIEKTKDFILNHPDLFENGDVFTACPECENGGPGDPRVTRDIDGHRKFLIDEYAVTKASFKKIKKNVASNYDSMNGDVARLIMDQETTKALDGIVTVDHYVSTPEKMAEDLIALSEKSGGFIILGEFGSPIPDIHGNQTEQEQAVWLDEAFQKLITIPQVKGMSYWTNTGGSTELWSGSGVPRLAVSTITKYYNPMMITLAIQDHDEKPIRDATITVYNRTFTTLGSGSLNIPYSGNPILATVSARGYVTSSVRLETNKTPLVAVLESTAENKGFDLHNLLKAIFPFL